MSGYYGKLKGYWDKISSIEPFPECTCEALGKCTCGILKKMMNRDEKHVDRFYHGTKWRI